MDGLRGARCGTWQYRATQAVETPEDLPWITGSPLGRRGAAWRSGQSGFHAAPDADGMVEVGYGVDPAYRRRGYARAALELAIIRAQDDPTVRTLRATISPDNEASLALIRSTRSSTTASSGTRRTASS